MKHTGLFIFSFIACLYMFNTVSMNDAAYLEQNGFDAHFEDCLHIVYNEDTLCRKRLTSNIEKFTEEQVLNYINKGYDLEAYFCKKRLLKPWYLACCFAGKQICVSHHEIYIKKEKEPVINAQRIYKIPLESKVVDDIKDGHFEWPKRFLGLEVNSEETKILVTLKPEYYASAGSHFLIFDIQKEFALVNPVRQ